MKKLVSLLLALCMCFSVGGMFSACENPSNGSQNSTPPAEEQSGWSLPEKMTVPMDGTMTEIVFNWTENSCTFTAEGTTYLFAYDEATGCLDVSITGGTAYMYDDLCVFDDNGYLTSMNFEEVTVMKLSYENDKMQILSWGEEGDFSPVEISADWNEHKVLMPPFDDSADFMYFTEYGDLYSGEGRTLYTYEYDDKGNILSVSPSWADDFSLDFTYGDTPMTSTWQRVPIKFTLVWTLGQPFAVFSMDMLCLSLYQQQNVK